jgi:hypothetical protein
MIQVCDVDLRGLDVCDLPLDGFGTEETKPVGGFIGGVHLLLALPQPHREHLTLQYVGEEHSAAVTFLHLDRRDDVLYDRPVPLLYAIGAYVEVACPREHIITAFLARGMEDPFMSYFPRCMQPDLAPCQEDGTYADDLPMGWYSMTCRGSETSNLTYSHR